MSQSLRRTQLRVDGAFKSLAQFPGRGEEGNGAVQIAGRPGGPLTDTSAASSLAAKVRGEARRGLEEDIFQPQRKHLMETPS